MAELSRSLTLHHEEPSAALRRNAPVRRVEQLWIALGLPDSSRDAFAHWACERLTPVVSIAAPGELLLEVQGSLRLFGGLEGLKRGIVAELDERRLTFRSCAARTPLAALWLARHAAADALDDRDFVGRLSALPLHVTRWPEDVLVLLSELGARTIGDCLRLPRDGFARRVGTLYLRDLDKALGTEPDPRLRFRAPEALGWTIDFSLETTDRAVLASAAEAMVADLSASLRRRQSQIRGVELVFRHRRCAPTTSRVELVSPVHEKRRLLGPLIARLESLELAGPVTTLGLNAGELLPIRLDAMGLFPELDGVDEAPGAAMIEVLRGRFGPHAVHGITLLAEHRPERVWRRLTEHLQRARRDTAIVSPWAHERPLWILPYPLTLAQGVSLLRYAGILSRESEPERIESGWWDGADIRRDYYTVATGCGQRLWVYEDCTTREWYLHGIFG